jgi:predicted DCC family thiol-disulfide oxidoreductase YuxK
MLILTSRRLARDTPVGDQNLPALPIRAPAAQSFRRSGTIDHASMPRSKRQPEIVFYDGYCGLCHRTVKFVLNHDRSGIAFRFAPLQGKTFLLQVPADQRAGIPDSVAVQTHDGSLLVRSGAFLHILRQLGGGWRILAAVVAPIPRPVRDLVYDFIARVRYRLFRRRDDLCPVVPSALRSRFDP